MTGDRQPLAPVYDRDALTWRVFDDEGRELGSFDTCHDAEQWILHGENEQ